jgi:hypothetical protein
LEDAVSFTQGEIVVGGRGSLPTPHLDNLLQRSTFHPTQNDGAFTTGNGELIKIQVLHKPQQGETFPGPQIVLPLLELADVFAVGFQSRLPRASKIRYFLDRLLGVHQVHVCCPFRLALGPAEIRIGGPLLAPQFQFNGAPVQVIWHAF